MMYVVVNVINNEAIICCGDRGTIDTNLDDFLNDLYSMYKNVIPSAMIADFTASFVSGSARNVPTLLVVCAKNSFLFMMLPLSD